MRIFLPSSASMDERDLCKKTDKKETNFEGDLFSEDYYRISVNDDNKNVISIERTAEISDIPKEQLYGENDIVRIMQEMLGASGEIRENIVNESISNYDEYENGFQTGKAVSVTYDSGYIKYIVLRNGKIIGTNNASEFIDKKEAYKAAISEIQKKYADKNVEIKEEYNENLFTVFYYPHKECLCYKFDIEGAVDGKWGDELSIFVFTAIINVNDVSDIEIASTFGY